MIFPSTGVLHLVTGFFVSAEESLAKLFTRGYPLADGGWAPSHTQGFTCCLDERMQTLRGELIVPVLSAYLLLQD